MLLRAEDVIECRTLQRVCASIENFKQRLSKVSKYSDYSSALFIHELVLL